MVLVELFGGIASGFEALLLLGVPVRGYYFCDKDPVAQRIAFARLLQLQKRFPHLLSPGCIETMFLLPQDVQAIDKSHLESIGQIDLLIAGWECQGFSIAGFQKGLADSRSVLVLDPVQILNWAQELNPNVGYLLENTPAQLGKPQLQPHALTVQHLIGAPFMIDAAQCNSYAHRLRNFGTNLAPLCVLKSARQKARRDPGLYVSDIEGCM